GRFFRAFNTMFEHVRGGYTGGVAWMLRRGLIGALLFLGMVGIAIYLWRATPGSLVPDEDQGYYISAVILPDGSTLERTFKVVNEVEKAIRSNPNNQDIIAFTGFDFIGGGFRNNAATIFVTQKHWDEREVKASQLVGELFGKTAGIKEALVLAFNPPAIFGLGTAGGFEFYIQSRGTGGAKRLDEVKNAFLARANRDPMLGGAQTLWRATVPYTSGPDSLDRFNDLPAVKIIGQAAPGVSSGQAITRVEEIAKEVLPADFSYDWGGTSYQEKRSGGASTFALGLAVIMV